MAVKPNLVATGQMVQTANHNTGSPTPKMRVGYCHHSTFFLAPNDMLHGMVLNLVAGLYVTSDLCRFFHHKFFFSRRDKGPKLASKQLS